MLGNRLYTHNETMNAEQILEKHVGLGILRPYANVKDAMIEFAKIKVAEAIEAIKENVDYGIHQNDDGQEPFHHESNIFVDHRTIYNAYSLDYIE